MARAYKAAEAYVELTADSSKLKTDVRTAIRDATNGATGSIGLTVDANARTRLRAEVRSAVNDATRGVEGNVKLSVDRNSLNDLRNQLRSMGNSNRGPVGGDVAGGMLGIGASLTSIGASFAEIGAAFARTGASMVSTFSSVTEGAAETSSTVSSLTEGFAEAGSTMSSFAEMVATGGMGMVVFVGTLSMAVAALPLVIAGVGALGGVFVALAASIGLALSSLIAIIPAIAAFAAIAAVVGLAVYGITKAVTASDELKSLNKQMADTETSNASRMKSAYQAVSDAKRAQADTFEQTARSIRNAEERLADAQDRHRKTQESLNEARKEAIKDLKDLKDAARDAGLDEERARVNLEKAKARFNQLNREDINRTTRQWRDAELEVREAAAALDEAIEQNAEAKEKSAKADQLGVEGTERVVRAKEAEQDASKGVAEAERNLLETRADAAKAQERAALQVARAQQGVADAQKASAIAIADLNEKISEQKGILDNLGPAGATFLSIWERLKTIFDQMQTTAITGMLPGINYFLDSIAALAPTVMPHILRISQIIGSIFVEFGKFLRTPEFKQFLDVFLKSVGDLLLALAPAIVPLTRAFTQIIEASMPLVVEFAGWFAGKVVEFADWIDRKAKDGSLVRFFQDSRAEMLKWIRVLEEIWFWVKLVWNWLEGWAKFLDIVLFPVLKTGYKLFKDWVIGLGLIGDKTKEVWDKIKDFGTNVKNSIQANFEKLPGIIQTSLNTVIDKLNEFIGKVNVILPAALDINLIPRLGANASGGAIGGGGGGGNQRFLASGGPVIGPGSGTSDDVPIMASNGEFVLRAAAVQKLGLPLLSRLNNVDISGDPGAMGIRKFADGGLISKTQEYIRYADSLPYVFGNVGPNSYDCSGLTGEVFARLTGRPSYRRYFVTGSNFLGMGWKPGTGTYTIGVNEGHMAGNLAGLAFEAASSRSGIKVGSSAKNVLNFARQYYLPEVGGQFVGGGSSGGLGGLFSLGTALSPVMRMFDPIFNGFANNLNNPYVSGLAKTGYGKLKDRVNQFDSGGWLPTGWSMAYNGTGAPERVVGPNGAAVGGIDEARLAHFIAEELRNNPPVIDMDGQRVTKVVSQNIARGARAYASGR